VVAVSLAVKPNTGNLTVVPYQALLRRGGFSNVNPGGREILRCWKQEGSPFDEPFENCLWWRQ
jgi:hypothetical protein